MKYVFIFLLFALSTTARAQDNVADIAHAFMQAVKKNDLHLIDKFYVDAKLAYSLLPKDAVGMSLREQNEKYIKPLHVRFEDNFKKIQTQIKDKNIKVSAIDLRSYKLEDVNEDQPKNVRAMSLYFDYMGEEKVIPISVVSIDEKWYILEILFTSNLF